MALSVERRTLGVMTMPAERLGRDWRRWHEPYEDAHSPLSRRLRVVQRLIKDALDGSHATSIRAISACAGQARDLLEVLVDHPRRDHVTARLVELDLTNAAHAARLANDAGLVGVEVVAGDASISSAYAGAVPADLVLMCGVFGNVPDDDVHRTIRFLPAMCAQGASVIWTRHRRAPDLTVQIREWFVEAGFEEIAFVAPDDTWFGVGAHRLVGPTARFARDVRLFTFFR